MMKTVKNYVANFHILVVGYLDEEVSSLVSMPDEIQVDVIRAGSKEEILDKVRTFRFAYILINLNNLGEDAFRLAELLRKNKSSRSTPLIFHTNNMNSVKPFFKGHERGVVDYLAGPIDKEKLENKTEVFMQHYYWNCRHTEMNEERERLLLELEVLNDELDEKNEQIKMLSSIDGLTGLFNRHYFENNIAREWRQAARERNSLSLLLVRLDNFKEYRKHYGEAVGDGCLREIAQALHKVLLRPVDTIARYGEEAFAVLLPETETEGAGKVAERMLSTVRGLAISHPASGSLFYLSISVGGATLLPESRDTLLALISEAEKALLLARESGGDCIRMRR